MLCAHCGATSDEGQRFCYNCGSRLNEPQPQQVAAPAQPFPAPPPAPAPPAGYQQAPGQYPMPTTYQQAPVGYAPQAIPNSPLAIASLVSGILAWVFLPFIAAVIAIVTGHMARGEIRRSGGRFSGEGMAIIGMILGYVQLAMIALGACFFLFVIVAAS
jgi:hypothetical protein